MQKIQKVFCLLALIGLGSLSARATTFLQFQSTYLGDGWFKYHLAVMNDSFFSSAEITDCVLMFTNQIDQVENSGWINYDVTNSYSYWHSTTNILVRPWERTFMIHSSETHFHLQTNNYQAATILLNLVPNSFNPMSGGVYAANIVGIASVPTLVPCNADDADDSPTNFVFDLKLLPDVAINQVLQTDGQIYGIDFNWGYESTFLLQGSSDMVNWADLATVWSYPPETTWESEDPLNDAGPFFRLELVGYGHQTLGSSVVAKTATAKVSASASASIVDCKAAAGQMIVTVNSPDGKTSQVEALNAQNVVVQTRPVILNGTSGTATFDAAALPGPVFFRAVTP